ncbi:hypothetical protein PROFUN_02559 [Planoprotostelium fungivorum]|uniref:Uncharacterized protein n=1 Tax=Planoprotostelium fungivorum TaxID=1890364 RepID=A0A2P6MPB5_9EUKA|nr:hypothetical protein PROFUN_02559 [Planoprotostelium fungivorum]
MSFGGGGKKESPFRQFFLGGASGCAAACFTHPIDLVKVRMQITGEEKGAAAATAKKSGMLKTGIDVARSEGIMSLYKGLSASLLRQATYTTVRFGLYLQFKEALSRPGEKLSLWKSLACSMAAGAGGAIAGSPADVVLVRMQADGKLPLDQRRGYKNAIDGLAKIVREEGPMALTRGCIPNIYRAMLMTAGQLTSYDQAKAIILAKTDLKDGTVVHVSASVIAAFVASVITNPMDVIKTRIMNQAKTAAPGTVLYKSSLDCAVNILKHEGPLGFWKGFIPFFVRLGPHTVLTFVFFEQFSRLLNLIAK